MIFYNFFSDMVVLCYFCSNNTWVIVCPLNLMRFH